MSSLVTPDALGGLHTCSGSFSKLLISDFSGFWCSHVKRVLPTLHIRRMSAPRGVDWMQLLYVLGSRLSELISARHEPRNGTSMQVLMYTPIGITF